MPARNVSRADFEDHDRIVLLEQDIDNFFSSFKWLSALIIGSTIPLLIALAIDAISG